MNTTDATIIVYLKYYWGVWSKATVVINGIYIYYGGPEVVCII